MDKGNHYGWLRISFLPILILAAFFLLAGCSSNSDISGGSTSNNSGWITIKEPTESPTYDVNDKQEIRLSGTAFFSPTYYSCYSVGFWTYYCNPGITVTWVNETTSESGSATVPEVYCPLVCETPQWSTTVPLALGVNVITVFAADPPGNWGTDSITVTRNDTLAPEVSSVDPADGSTGIALDTSITVAFSEQIITSTIDDSSFYLTDIDDRKLSALITSNDTGAVLLPDAILQHSSIYNVYVTTAVTDQTGKPLADTFQWSFTSVDRSWDTDFYIGAQARFAHSAIWTGSKMIIWGGYAPWASLNPYTLADGKVYDPTSNTSYYVSSINKPIGSGDHTAIWTGSEMIIWGGKVGIYDGVYVEWSENSGARYDPTTNTWTTITTNNAPEARYRHSAIWTGSEMIIWGGQGQDGLLNTGARYNPQTDVWTTITITGAPSSRYKHAAIWTGAEMVIWGDGYLSNTGAPTGGRYNPTSNTWTPTSIYNAPEARVDFSAVWTGTDLLIWGGQRVDGFVKSYPDMTWRYNPTEDNWQIIPTLNNPQGRYSHSAVWTGTELIIWGGLVEDVNNVDIYNDEIAIWHGGKLSLQ